MNTNTIVVTQKNPKTGQSEQRAYTIGQPTIQPPAEPPRTYRFNVYPVAADKLPGLPQVAENAKYEEDEGYANRVTIDVTVAPRPQSEGPEEEIARKAIPSALRDQIPRDLGGPEHLKVTI